MLLLESFSELLLGSVAATEEELTWCDWMKTELMTWPCKIFGNRFGCDEF